MSILTNPVTVSVVVLCVLSLLKLNVLLAMLVACIVGGLVGGIPVYSAETDTYIVSYARGYWNGDLYYLDFDENEKVKKPQISETDTELIATVETYYGPDLGAHENIRKMEYRFDKVIDDEFLFYRLSGIKEIS